MGSAAVAQAALLVGYHAALTRMMIGITANVRMFAKDGVLLSTLACAGWALAFAWHVYATHYTWIVGLYALSEVAFYALQTWRYHKLNAVNVTTRPQGGVQERLQAFLTLKGVVDFREFMSGWFMKAPFEALRRDNLLDFVAYGFWYKERSTMSDEEQAGVEAACDELLRTFGVTCPPGRNPDASFMSHLWHDLRVVHKPLWFHALSEASLVISHACLKALGFRCYHVRGFSYWVRGAGVPRDRRTGAPVAEDSWLAEDCRELVGLSGVGADSEDDGGGDDDGDESPRGAGTCAVDGPSIRQRRAAAARRSAPSDSASLRSTADSTSESRRGTSSSGSDGRAATVPDGAPLVFMHGVGFGMLPYLGFVRRLLAGFPGKPLFVLEVRHVSLRLCTQARGVDEIAVALDAMLRRHRFRSAHFVAHSFGTFVIAQARHMFPRLVKSTLLINPVCMMTCDPGLLQTFVYHDFTLLSLVRRPFNFAKLYVSRDLYISDAFCRKFWWHSLMLWPDQLPAATVLQLSTGDDLVPWALVLRHLRARGVLGEGGVSKGGGVRVLIEDGPHGQFLLQPRLQDRLIAEYKAALAAVQPSGGGA